MSQRTSVIIDTDPGVDDAVAIALALTSPEIDVMALTTVAGNFPLAVTTNNALGILAALGRSDVPVASGADRPLVKARSRALAEIHGHGGLGGVRLTKGGLRTVPTHAVDYAYQLLLTSPPKSITIVALGPLTNLALLLAMHPEAAELIGRVVVMGGSTGAGNVTPAAEFNIWSDPEAAARVLGDEHLDVTAVGLDATERATINPEVAASLAKGRHSAPLLAAMLEGYGDSNCDGWPMHDALVVASLIDPAILRTRPASVLVATCEGPQRGQTRYTFTDIRTRDRVPRLDVAVDTDAQRLRKLLLERLSA